MTSKVFKAQCFVYCDVYICYGKAVEHGSLLNQSGICEELSVVIFFFVHTYVLSIKTALNMLKVHLIFRIMLLIQ